MPSTKTTIAIRTPRLWSITSALLLLLVLSGNNAYGEDPFQVSNLVDTETCFAAMNDADLDNSGGLDSEEYVQFAIAVSEGGLPPDTSETDPPPIPITMSFVQLSCLCQNPFFGGDPEDDECCTGDNASIVIPESPDESDTDQVYLYYVCDRTFVASEMVGMPSSFPTKAPTSSPTAAPVIAPTLPPTQAPSKAPTMAPTDEPTASPTIQPTVSPTLQPTASPTQAPTTAAPNVEPTASPTIVPTNPPVPTELPTISPTATPTGFPVVDVSVGYQIAIIDGQTLLQQSAFRQEYPSKLVAGMDELTANIDISNLRRSLQEVLESTLSEPDESVTCPDIFNETDVCLGFTATIPSKGVDPNALEIAVMRDINNGSFEDNLDNLQWQSVPDNPIRVIVSSSTPGPGVRSPDDSDDLGAGAIAGITIGALALILVPAAIYLSRRGAAEDDEDKNKEEVLEVDSKEIQSQQGSLQTDAAVQRPTGAITGATTLGAATLGAAVADYGGKDHLAEPGVQEDETSSNAGSSGWSSSAGISSLNTGSVDEEVGGVATTLTGIGVASAFSRQAPSDTESDVNPNRDQLDTLIESGDWAAVGATAALLAAASDSQSDISRGSRSRSSQSAGAARAAELDNLVDAGDWEGVVAAAARFEAQSGSRTNSSLESSGTGTGTGTGLSAATSLSETAVQKREEIRAEVEALVRRVVPEEIDNVDEMMKQFQGREDELVETLRTMQERAIAQKARAAGHKAAKVDARRNVQRGVVPGTSNVISKVTSLELQSSASGVSKPKDAGAGMAIKPRDALEKAIEEGDWEAVGEAAAMIQSDSSVGTASTGELNRLIAASGASLSSKGSTRSGLSGVQLERAAELDGLVDAGDWEGVAAAAAKYTESEKKQVGASKEEQDALKEAEVWMKIAEQTKGGTDEGASDAAEWAIQRSLSQLKEKDKKKKRQGGEDEV